jgi:hypothetical protein
MAVRIKSQALGRNILKARLIASERINSVFKLISCKFTHSTMRQRENIAVLKLKLQCTYVKKKN